MALTLLPTLAGLSAAAAGGGLRANPSATCYQPGQRIDAATYVYDDELRPQALLDLVRDSSPRVVVLVVFGGGAARIPDDGPFRGPLWCQDSFDDLAVQRALVGRFAGEPVSFVAVAVPPVLAPGRYGYPKSVFLTRPEGSKAFQTAARAFVRATRRHQESGLIPFDRVYYDPAFRLLYDPEVMKAEGRPSHAWEGRFKACSDTRRYGVPTIWLLAPDGTVLVEPFRGNDYGSVPPEIHYGFRDLEEAIRRLLAR